MLITGVGKTPRRWQRLAGCDHEVSVSRDGLHHVRGWPPPDVAPARPTQQRTQGEHIRGATPASLRKLSPPRWLKPLFGKATLKVAGRDQTKLADGLAKQVALVAAAVADIELDIPVHGCFCFVHTELPLLGTPTINGLSIFGRRGLAKQLNMAGELSAERARMVAAAIGERFPVA